MASYNDPDKWKNECDNYPSDWGTRGWGDRDATKRSVPELGPPAGLVVPEGATYTPPQETYGPLTLETNAQILKEILYELRFQSTILQEMKNRA